MASLRALVNWRPRTPFYYGWLVLSTAAMGAFASTGVTQLVLGGIQNFITDDLGWSRSSIALGATMGTWASGVLSPIAGRLVDKRGPRGMMPIAAVIVGLCFFAISSVHALWQFYAAYIIARAIANPIMIGIVPRTIAVNFFQRKRNLAIGLTAMARPIGGSINIQLIALIAAIFSWRAAYRYMGVMALVMVIPLFLIMRRRPEDVGLLPDGDAPSASDGREDWRPGSPTVQRAQEEFSWRVSEAARTSTFWLIVGSQAAVVMISSAVNFQIVPYLQGNGLSAGLAVGALSIGSLLGALGNPVWGFLSDKFSPKTLALAGLIITSLIMSLFLVSSGGAGFFIFIAYGAVSGGINVLGGMMQAQYFGRYSYGSISGAMQMIQTGALGAGPTFSAIVLSVTDGFRSLFLFGVIAFALAAIMVLFISAPRLPRRAFTQEGHATQD